MVRRLSALVLALVLVGSPVAATMCRATCATHQTHDTRAMAGHVHAGHSHAASILARSGVTFVGAQACGHQADGSVAVQRILRGLDVPAIVAVQAAVLPPMPPAGLARQGACVEHSPSGSLALVAQLRV